MASTLSSGRSSGTSVAGCSGSLAPRVLSKLRGIYIELLGFVQLDHGLPIRE